MDKNNVPYYQVAREALIKWNGLKEEQADKMIEEYNFEEIEGQMRQLEIEITLPDIYENYVLMGEKCKELDEMKRVLALVMEEWVQLSE